MNDRHPKIKDRYAVRKSIDKINTLAGAPLDGWEYDPVIELAKPTYITKLLEIYDNEDFDEDDKFYTMSFLFTCFEAAVTENINIVKQWDEAVTKLEKNIDLHACTLVYWSCYGIEHPEDTELMFPITIEVREVWNKYINNYL